MTADSIAKIRRGNLYRVIYLGFCFMLALTACNAAQNMMTQIFTSFGYRGLSQLVLATQNGMFITASFFSSHLIKKFSPKQGFFMGMGAYACFISGGTLLTYCAQYDPDTFFCEKPFMYTYNLLSVAVLGCLATIFWISEAFYVNKCADDSTRGLCNGVFMALMQSAQLTSSLLSTLLLRYTNPFTFYVVLLGVELLAVTLVSFARKPLEYPTGQAQVESEAESEAEPEPETAPEPEAEADIWTSVKSYVRGCLMNKNYFFLFSVMIFSGVTLGFFPNYLGTATTLTLNTMPNNILEEKIGFVFIVLAVGEVLAGLIIGRLCDKFNKFAILGSVMFMGLTALTVTFLAVIFDNYDVAVMSGFLWGFTENSTQSTTLIVIASNFKASPELFSAYGQLQAFGVLSISFLVLGTPDVDPRIIMGIFAGIYLILQSVFLYNVPRKAKAPKDVEDSLKTRLVSEATNVTTLQEGVN